MKKVLFIFKKTVNANYILEWVKNQEFFLSEFGSDVEINYFLTFSLGTLAFDIPHSLPLSITPRVESPSYIFKDGSNYCHLVNEKTRLKTAISSDSAFRSMIEEHERVYWCVDPDHTGYGSVALLFERAYGSECFSHLNNIQEIIIYSFTEKEFIKAFSGSRPMIDNHPLILSYKVKQYFDYNWLINALPIFKQVIKHSNLVEEPFFLSKYGLILLHHINTYNVQATKGELHNIMMRWKGTGKYTQRMKLGSVLSASTIIDNLIKLKAIEYYCSDDDIRGLKLSSAGKNLCELLHKRTNDQDLPFRLSIWMDEGLDESKEKMNSYLHSYFGKQKRFYSVRHN